MTEKQDHNKQNDPLMDTQRLLLGVDPDALEHFSLEDILAEYSGAARGGSRPPSRRSPLLMRLLRSQRNRRRTRLMTPPFRRSLRRPRLYRRPRRRISLRSLPAPSPWRPWSPARWMR